MNTRQLISNRSLDCFYDLLAASEAVRTIVTEFEAEGIVRKDGYVPRAQGERRSTAECYVANLDLASQKDVAKLLRVMASFLTSSEQRWSESRNYERFMKLMEMDGLAYSDGLWKSTVAIRDTTMEKLAEKHGMEYVRTELQRAQAQIEEDPEDAITAARALVESTCKWVLDGMSVEYDSDEDLSDLYKKVAERLNLSPDQHGQQIFKQILGSLAGAIGGLAALRNRYGDAHGKGAKYYRPSARHARFAVAVAGAMATLIAETYLK